MDKLEISYTPKHGSFLNVAEIELSRLGRQCLNRRIPDKETIIAEVKAWSNQRNMELCIVNWQFTSEDAHVKLIKTVSADCNQKELMNCGTSVLSLISIQ